MVCFVVTGCTATQPLISSGSTPSNDAVDNALRADPDDGFAMLYEPQPLRFPADHMPHPDYRTEWWYMTGNLDADDGRRFGFQVTWFRQGMTRMQLTEHNDEKTAQSPPAVSAWAAHDAWMGHVGVSDVSQETFHQAHRFARGAVGLAGASQNGDTTEIFLDRWQLDITEESGGHNGTLRLAVDTEATQLQLTGTRLGPTVLRGNQGHSQKAQRLATPACITFGRALRCRAPSRLRVNPFLSPVRHG